MIVKLAHQTICKVEMIEVDWPSEAAVQTRPAGQCVIRWRRSVVWSMRKLQSPSSVGLMTDGYSIYIILHLLLHQLQSPL